MKIYNLFLDDLRDVKDIYPNAAPREYVVERSFEGAKERVLAHGIPQFISFDNDLGENQLEGYDFAKFLVECEMDGVLKFPDFFSWHIHSANCKAWENIDAYFKGYFNQRVAS